MQKANPFSYVNDIVYEDGEFVGQPNELRIIRDKISNAKSPGSLALVGPYHSGKTSLAWRAIIYEEDQLLKNHMLWICLTLLDKHSSDDFYRCLVEQTMETIKEHAVEIAGLADCAAPLLLADFAPEMRREGIYRFFRLIKRHGWHVVVIVDDFDAAIRVFEHNPGAYQTIRVLATDHRWKIAFLLTARRSINEISARLGDSTLPGAIQSVNIFTFDDDDLMQLFAPCRNIGLTIDSDTLSFVKMHTGCHPYLATELAYRIADLWLTQSKLDLDESLHTAGPEFYRFYDSCIGLLDEENLLEPLLEILFGPVITATPAQADLLIARGILVKGDSGFYECFSSHFQEYLSSRERSTELWDIWSEMERQMRHLVNRTLQKHYSSETWIADVKRLHPSLKSILEECERNQEKDFKKYNSKSRNILDYTNFYDLKQFIDKYWPQFQPQLRDNRGAWSARFDLLAGVRAPMAHNRDILPNHTRMKAELECREVLALLAKSLTP